MKQLLCITMGIKKMLFEEKSTSYLFFSDFLFKDKFNRKLILLWLVAIVVKIFIFKYFYPNVAFINGDSYAYLRSAYLNLKVDLYPIGYSRFLRLVSVFSTSDFVLFILQYLLCQIACLLAVFSLFYFYVRLRITQVLLVLLLMISPLELYMSNYVSSDSLFLALSIFWITSLVWLINRFSLFLIVVHSFLLLLVFMVRYNALFYPFVSVVAFVIMRGRLWLKVVGIAAGFLLIGGFVEKTSEQYARETGVRQFSPFSGWQLANNGIYTYYFIDSAHRKDLPPKFKKLDMMVRGYFDTTHFLMTNYPEQMLDISAQFMWDNKSPLRKYMKKEFEGDSLTTELVGWSKMAPLYGEYGKALIKTYPGAFIKRYIWPNLIRYYVPPVEFLSNYGYRADTVIDIGKRWFDYKSNKLETRFKNKSVGILNYYPIISGVLNAVFVMMSISFFLLNGVSIDRVLFKFWLLIVGFWICNMLFSVFASPIALRFQSFPILLCFFADFLLLDFMLVQEKYKGKEIEGALIEAI
ncbi:hypothetical protein [Chitinophaga sp.]|uniref:hypothetical protein n=1 Tax=Chitinophaga sp. TaxID=1869181 RepID=UPI0031D1DA8A